MKCALDIFIQQVLCLVVRINPPHIHAISYIYCRLNMGSWCPTTVCWGGNNRTVLLRVPANNRVEHRLPDGSTNLYLSLAIILASGLDGLRNKLGNLDFLHDSFYLKPVIINIARWTLKSIFCTSLTHFISYCRSWNSNICSYQWTSKVWEVCKDAT